MNKSPLGFFGITYGRDTVYYSYMQQYIQNLKWRYATKKFDVAKKLSSEQLELLKQSLILSPSSFGLQPWKFYVVENQELRQKIKDAAYGQGQITDASHLFVLASKIDISSSDVHIFIEDVAKKRGLLAKENGKTAEALVGYEEMINGSIAGLDKNAKDSWTARQVYIALGFLLSAAAQNEIDSCPMEGFDVEKVNAILEITKDGYSARVLCPVGFRSEDDEYSKYPKVRFEEERIIKTIK